MAVAQRLLRSMLKEACRLPIPGRYVAVEAATPFLAPFEPVVGEVGAGLRMRCDLRDQVQRQIYYGLYESLETRLVKQRLRKGDTFLDIGANVGYYTLLAAEAVGPPGKVHAFEPVSDVCALLTQNVRANSLTNVTVNELAMSGSRSDLELFVRPAAGSTGWASIVPSRKYENQTIQVAATTLDDYVAMHQLESIALIKLDIEGAEPQALEGGAKLLAGDDAPDLLCEINPLLLDRAGVSGRELKLLIGSFGYTLYEITAVGPKPLRIDSDEHRLKNVLASKCRVRDRV